MNSIIKHYHWPDLLADANKPGFPYIRPDSGYSEWEGVSSRKEARELAENGWQDGKDKAMQISAPIIDDISHQIERIDANYDLEGHEIDVSRFVDGEPECWLNFQPVMVEGTGRKLITLVFNASVSGGISTDTIIKKGSIACALVELLEYAGHRVQVKVVIAAESQHPNGKYVEMSVLIKEFDQILNMGRVMFALAHPAMLRSIFISASEVLIGDGGSIGSMLPVVKARLTGDIVIDGSGLWQDCWRTKEKMEAWIKAQLESQGVHIKKETVPA